MMNETMGQIIRRLRKNADLTQEDLADQLGITYQAVSRWENDTGMPDVSQIVPLANVFDVPIDVLFGRVGQNADEEVDVFEARMLENEQRHESADDQEELRWRLDRTDQYRKMVEMYPNNVKLLYGAMTEGIYAVSDYEEDNEDDTTVLPPDDYRALLEECIKWGDRIVRLEAGTDGFFYSVRCWQIGAFVRLDEKEKAYRIAQTLPKSMTDIAYGQQAEIARIAGDREAEIKSRATMVVLLLEELENQAVMMAAAYRDSGEYADAGECYAFSRRLEAAVYGEEAWSPPFVLPVDYRFTPQAACLVLEGREDEAITLLEEYFDYAVRHTEAWNTRQNAPSSSPLLRTVPWTYNPAVKRNPKKELTDGILTRKTFERLRGNPRFNALVKKIEELPDEG